jgi:hypothetical protein
MLDYRYACVFRDYVVVKDAPYRSLPHGSGQHECVLLAGTIYLGAAT